MLRTQDKPVVTSGWLLRTVQKHIFKCPVLFLFRKLLFIHNFTVKGDFKGILYDCQEVKIEGWEVNTF